MFQVEVSVIQRREGSGDGDRGFCWRYRSGRMAAARRTEILQQYGRVLRRVFAMSKASRQLPTVNVTISFNTLNGISGLQMSVTTHHNPTRTAFIELVNRGKKTGRK